MSNESNTNRTHDRGRWVWGFVLGGLTLGAVALRVPFWNHPVRCDEATVFLRFCQGHQRPLFDFLSHYSTPGRHGLHGLAVALLSYFTGAGFPWARLPAFVAGVLTVPLTFVAMRLWVGRSPAAIAALLMACSPWCVAYSVNARGYTLGICLVLIAVWYLGKTNAGRPGWYPIAAGMALGAAAYTIHTTIYFAPAVAVWYAWRWLTDRSPRSTLVWIALSFFVSMAITLIVLFLPIMLHGEFGNVTGNRMVSPLGFAEAVASLPDYLRKNVAMIAGGMQPPLVVWVAVAVGATVAVVRRTEGAVMMLMALAVVPPVLLLQRVLPPPRAMTYLLPFAYALGGLGVVAALEKLREVRRLPLMVPARVVAFALVVFMCVCLGRAVVLLPHHPGLRGDRDTGIRDAIHAAALLIKPNDVVFSQSWISPLIRYEQWKMGRPESRIVRPRLDVRRAVLFWPPHWREDEKVVQLLGSYRCDEVLYDDGRTRIARVSRADGDAPASASLIGTLTSGELQGRPKPREDSARVAHLPEE